MTVRTIKTACGKAVAIAMTFAAGATLTANAAENIYWTGGSGGTEAEPLDINTSNYTNVKARLDRLPTTTLTLPFPL